MTIENKAADPVRATQILQIEDPWLTTFIAVCAMEINKNMGLVSEFARIYGDNYRPVNNIRMKDPGSGTMAEGGNTDYPILCIWRKSNRYYSFTSATRLCKATCGIKYILPSNDDQEQGFATLNRIALALDGQFEDMIEDQHGGDLLEKAGITSWAVQWTGKFNYHGPNNQGLYPVMEADVDFEHEANPFDPSFLPNMIGLILEHNLYGIGSDGDADPAINPRLIQELPERAPAPQSPPPLSRPSSWRPGRRLIP